MKSVTVKSKKPGSSGAHVGHLVPGNSGKICVFERDFSASTDYLVPNSKRTLNSAYLDGNFARRDLPVEGTDYCIWDTELKGFGLRVRPSGRYQWFVRLRERGRQRRVTLGWTVDVDAEAARNKARAILKSAALDGLPKPPQLKAAPTLADFVTTNWSDLARCWKPSTTDRNAAAWRRDLAPVFGQLRVSEIAGADVTKWRDDCAGEREAIFNRSVPVLAALLKYAEALQVRRKGSNPCRGIARYKRQPCERYLSPQEYRRLGGALNREEADHGAQVAIVRLLLFTGARVSEIRDLRWEWVRPPRIALLDSKTGPKTIWLNRQAVAIFDAIPRKKGCPYVFPNHDGTRPINLNNWWVEFRRGCALPDVRLHDLRHSFASTAIMNGVPLTTIGKLLGHQLPETTAKYAHLADEVIADAAVRISGALAQAIGLKS